MAEERYRVTLHNSIWDDVKDDISSITLSTFDLRRSQVQNPAVAGNIA
jgi:hypothetical protein